MPHDIKLHVFTLSLREKYKPNTQLQWKDVINHLSGASYEKKFIRFFEQYVKHFDGKFTVYQNWPKGINIRKKSLTFGSTENYILGKVEGGPTDLGGTLKSKSNIDDPGFQVTKDHVNSIPHYFLLWIPRESDKGVLVVQSLGDRTIYEPLKLNIKKFIESIDEKFFIDYKEYITKEAIDKMRNRGVVKELIFRRSALPSDKAERVFNKKYNIIDNINVEIRISGFGSSTSQAIKDFFQGKYPDLIEMENFNDLGIDSESEILATLRHNNKQAVAKKQDFSLAPIYIVDTTDVPLNVYNHPNENKMKDYLKSFLLGLKSEMGI